MTVALALFVLPNISISAELPFQTKSINTFTYTQTLSTTGELRPFRSLIVKSKISEEVAALPVSEGDSVTQGKRILRFDTDLLQTRMSRSRHQMVRARHQRDIAEKNYKRKQSLLNKDLVSQSEFDQSKLEYDRARENYKIARQNYREARINYSHTQVQSPFHGYIEEHLVEIGEQVPRGQPLIELIQLDPLQLEFEVTAAERNYITRGETVQLNLSQEPENSIKSGTPPHNPRGTITTINRDRNKNGLYTVKARVPNSEHTMVAGKTVGISLPLRTFKEALKIPLNYLDREGDQTRIVLFDSKNKTIHRRPLTIIDYRDTTVVSPLEWPKSWELVPGGLYTEIPEQFE